MSGLQIFLEIALAGLLAVTLFHAVRLERALGVLKRSRTALEPLVEGFDASTRQAEAAIARLHEAAEGAGRQIGRQSDTAMSLKDDLAFLVERGDRLANRIDALVRSARPLAAEPPRLVSDRVQTAHPAVDRLSESRAERPPDAADRSRVRSQAERDLLKALRMAR